MKRVSVWKTTALLLGALGVFGAGLAVGANKFGTPSSILHVVTIHWKADATDAQKQEALQGVKKMAGEIPGIKNVWIKATKVQPREYTDAFAIEFEDKAAADRYVDHPAHRAWEKGYLAIREESRSHQITN
jgi:hypothetical protein